MNTPRENPETNNIPQEQHECLCAYVFGELHGEDRAAFEAELVGSPELQAEQARLEATIGLVKLAVPETGLSQDARRDLFASARRSRFRVLRGRGLALAAAAFLVLIGGGFALRWISGEEAKSPYTYALFGDKVARAPAAEPNASRMKEMVAPQREAGDLGYSREELSSLRALGYDSGEAGSAPQKQPVLYDQGPEFDKLGIHYYSDNYAQAADQAQAPAEAQATLDYFEAGSMQPGVSTFSAGTGGVQVLSVDGSSVPSNATPEGAEGWFPGQGEKKAEAKVVSVTGGTDGALGARYDKLYRGPSDTVPPGRGGEVAAAGPTSPGPGGPTSQARAGVAPLGYVGEAGEAKDDEALGETRAGLEKLGYGGDDEDDARLRLRRSSARQETRQPVPTVQQVLERSAVLCDGVRLRPGETPRDMFFRYWGDNPLVPTEQDALSTFAVDVDTASYTLTRAYLNRGQLPPREAVRTEEFVNYFRADQPAPTDGSPFAIGLELAPTPFTPDARTELLRVTVRAKDVADFERQPLALTFVVDVSGSMAGERIGFVKDALTTLLGQLYAGDSVAIVAFSNESREVSPMVSAGNRGPLEQAIAALSTGGGTSVEAGLRQGYAIAAGALTRNAVNRVILCSDGVGNIGETKGDALLALVAEQRARGIYLNTVGVGMGNHNDAFLEQLADKGDGLCQYVDSAAEARKVFGQDLAKALQPVARDVKIQVEFDPAQVEAWRQLGYENRALKHEDFRNDTIDAGEVNAGHQVSALYEVVRTANPGGPLATVRLRYKPPFPVDRGDTSELGRVESEAAREIERAISFTDSRPGFVAGSLGFRRSAVAAQLAEILPQSQHARGASLAKLADAAQALASQSDDPEVAELAELVAKARPMVEARDAQETPRVQGLLDRLARLHYERGQRERKRVDVDEDTLKREAAEIARLEAEVRQAVGEDMGVDPGTLESLRDIGYAEGEEEPAPPGVHKQR